MKKVLVIDDDKVFRASVVAWLKGRDWQVLEADDGEAGLNLAFEHQPDAVVCDLLMPRCNGYQVIRTLRERADSLSRTKILVTTGSVYPSDRFNALECGADEFMIKPLKRADFINLLQKWTGQPGTTVEPSGPSSGDGSDKTIIRFWGVRGSLPTPGPTTVFYGGNTSCLEIRADGEVIILDAGSGIRCLGNSLAAEFKGRPLAMTLLLTHTHWDHIQGFPFFAPAYNPNNRLRVLSCEGVRKGLESTLSIQMESPFFPISMRQMPGNITVQEIKNMEFEIGKVKVTAAFMNHPGVCVGYRLNTSHGSVAFLPDNELFQRLKAVGPSKSAEDMPDMEAFAKHQDQKMVDFLKGVDVLITDSQYDETEYLSRVGWGHSCSDDSVALAVAAEAKLFFLFHHDPSHDDEKISRMVARGRELAHQLGSSVRVEGAREGLEVVLPIKA